MRALTRFWPSLECVAAVSTVSAQWMMLLGAEYEWTKRFFRPLKELALSCLRLDRQQTSYHVEIVAPNHIVGICDETGEEINLSADDLVVYELDRPVFCQSVARAFGMAGSPMPIEGLAWTERLGYYIPVAGRRLPAYVAICWRTADFVRAVTRLVAMQHEPFLLFAPTSRYFTPVVQTLMQQSNGGLIPLGDALELDKGERFAATSSAAAMLEDFVETAIGNGHSTKVKTVGNQFQKAGVTWKIRFAGRSIDLPDSYGLGYLAQLIAHPGQYFHCATLSAAVHGSQDGVALGSSGADLDSEAMAAYKRRIVELRQELGLAQRHHDSGRQESIQAELDQLVSEITSAFGLGGRHRDHSDAEHLRTAVKMAITRAITKIGGSHPALHSHLKTTIQTGIYSSYRPDHAVDWVA